MHRKPLYLTFASVLLIVAFASAQADKEDGWPQFRGPNRDGISKETGLLTTWPEGGPKVLWKKNIGDGYSGISIVGNRVYTAYSIGNDEFLFCLKAGDGQEVWRFRLNENFIDEHGNGPRATPTVDGHVVYAMGALGMLYAVDAKSGKKIWAVDIHSKFGHPDMKNYGNPEQGVGRGYSSSPLIAGDLLITNVGRQPGKTVVALNKFTGATEWTSQSAKRTFASPIVTTIHGIRQVVNITGQEVAALLIDTGLELWRFNWDTPYMLNVAMPLFLPPDRIFISSGFNKGSALLKITLDGNSWNVEKLWDNRRFRNVWSSSIFYDGYIYGFDAKIFKCISAETGEEKWRQRGFGHGSLIYTDGHLIVLGEKGNLALVGATPSAYSEKANVQILEGKCWTAPSLCEGRLYIRNQKKIVCLDMTGPF